MYSICADHHQLGGTQLSEVEARETVVIQPSPCEVTANCPVHVTPRDLLCARLGTDLVPVGVHHIPGHLLGIGLMKKMDSAKGERGKRSRLVSFGYCTRVSRGAAGMRGPVAVARCSDGRGYVGPGETDA